MAKLSICIPTYARPAALQHLCSSILLPIHKQFGNSVEIFVRDNSIGLEWYDFSLIEDLFSFADYHLNPSNLSYHGNVLTLFERCQEDSYIWILPDDDSYNLTSIFRIIDAILSEELNADVILPPFSYVRNPNFISTKAITDILPATISREAHQISGPMTTFDELLRHNLYPYIPLTSSFIFRKRSSRHAGRIISENSTNAWLHEVLMLAAVDRFSSFQIVDCSPYVYYQETYDSNNKPLKSGMSIQYFHENNISLKRLRSVIFNEQKLFNPGTCWRETILWLIQDKDESIAWSNNSLYSYQLTFRATLFAIRRFDLWLLVLCICFLVLPSSTIKSIRHFRGSHRATSSPSPEMAASPHQ